MTRDPGGVAIRGFDTVDTTLRPAERLVGTREELGALWDELTHRNKCTGRLRRVFQGVGGLVNMVCTFSEPEAALILLEASSTLRISRDSTGRCREP